MKHHDHGIEGWSHKSELVTCPEPKQPGRGEKDDVEEKVRTEDNVTAVGAGRRASHREVSEETWQLKLSQDSNSRIALCDPRDNTPSSI